MPKIAAMDQQNDLLARVVTELQARDGRLREVAQGSGLPYDTVLRIKNQENDPGYSKVRKLADFLFQGANAPAPAAAQGQGG